MLFWTALSLEDDWEFKEWSAVFGTRSNYSGPCAFLMPSVYHSRSFHRVQVRPGFLAQVLNNAKALLT